MRDHTTFPFLLLLAAVLSAATLPSGCAGHEPALLLPGGERMPLQEGHAEHLLCRGGREGGSGRIGNLGFSCAPGDGCRAGPDCAALVRRARWDAFKRWFRASWQHDQSFPDRSDGAPVWPGRCP